MDKYIKSKKAEMFKYFNYIWENSLIFVNLIKKQKSIKNKCFKKKKKVF